MPYEGLSSSTKFWNVVNHSILYPITKSGFITFTEVNENMRPMKLLSTLGLKPLLSQLCMPCDEIHLVLYISAFTKLTSDALENGNRI